MPRYRASLTMRNYSRRFVVSFGYHLSFLPFTDFKIEHGIPSIVVFAISFLNSSTKHEFFGR
jgi:hypothetical protein